MTPLLPLFAQQYDTLFSIEVDRRLYFARVPDALVDGRVQYQWMDLHRDSGFDLVELRNLSQDTLMIRNFVPFGAAPNRVYITGSGDHPLSRTHLFLPGRLPVNVVCPDNAWDLGFLCIESRERGNIAALSRRDRSSLIKGQRSRFETLLYPGGSIRYKVWQVTYQGPWQEGLRRVFQEKKLFDLATFDDALYQRKDLGWIRRSYVMHLMQAWDRQFYDGSSGSFTLQTFLDRGLRLYGGDDVVGIWPTWPSLGMDQRNQFDLFRDLPGGTRQLQETAGILHRYNSHLFLCYNPWDESTRSEGHLAGISDLIRATDADGVVLDTRGESSRELQEAADRVKPGVIMYSEGMAVPRDMPGIVSGRVHNALYFVPLLNLNKFIKPDFAIFRVAELYKEPIRREFATSFFNGYGTELNIFAPGQPDWVEEQYRYLGKTTRILREHTNNFTEGFYTPLIPVSADSIWVNEWQRPEKTVYTIYSLRPQGYKGLLFNVWPRAGTHFVDLWHHKLLQPVVRDGASWIETETDAFHFSSLGTNNEGAVDAIVQFPEYITAHRNGDRLIIGSDFGDTLKIWTGAPDYEKKPLRLKRDEYDLRISDYFGRYEGRLVIQLFRKGELIDETIIDLPPGTPRRISRVTPLLLQNKLPTGMVRIPPGRFVFKESHGDDFIPYPTQDVDSGFDMPAFLMDRFPVTNSQFRDFLEATGYRPADSVNFLKHWVNGRIPAGMEQYPVVYVSYEDAKAFALWAEKRLPTELEWQYAAQTPALREWPWDQKKPVTRKEQVITETLTVTSIEGIDPRRCNLGDGQLYPVGKYPAGANPYGVEDLVGCVWQLTNDVYLNGSYTYIILKGGSYFKPSSSWWYVQGGPRELHYRQYLLRVSQGFERNATVGFRCVR